MELPSLPTDNLYKFMALSGIALVIVSMFPFFHAYKLEVEVIRLEADVEILQIQINQTKADMNELRKDTDKFAEQTDEFTEKSENLTEQIENLKETNSLKKDSLVDNAEKKLTKTDVLTKKGHEILERLSELQKITLKYEIENANNRAKINEHKYLNRMIYMESKVGCTVFVSGLLLAIIGFTLWYKRLQVPQDRMLQMNAEGNNIQQDTEDSNK